MDLGRGSEGGVAGLATATTTSLSKKSGDDAVQVRMQKGAECKARTQHASFCHLPGGDAMRSAARKSCPAMVMSGT